MSDAPPAPQNPLAAALASRRNWLVVAGLLVLLLASRAILGPRTAPHVYFDIPPFELVSHEGAPFGSRELAGRAWIAGFFFTRCPTVCPVLLQRQAEVERRSDRLGSDLQLITISIDPAHDTPEVMKAHAAARGLDLSRWTLLTGATEDIQRLVRDGFKEYLEAGPDRRPEDVVHSVRFFLVDRKGRVRGLYDGMDESQVGRLLKDAAAVLREP